MNNYFNSPNADSLNRELAHPSSAIGAQRPTISIASPNALLLSKGSGSRVRHFVGQFAAGVALSLEGNIPTRYREDDRPSALMIVPDDDNWFLGLFGDRDFQPARLPVFALSPHVRSRIFPPAWSAPSVDQGMLDALFATEGE